MKRLAAVLLCLIAGGALAHALAPALLQITHHDNTTYDVVWRFSKLQESGAVPAPLLPDTCRELSQPALQPGNDTAREYRWQVQCSVLTGQRVAIENLENSLIDVILRITHADNRQIQLLLNAESPQIIIPAGMAITEVFQRYLRLGVTHLILGPDHLLFVLGLALIATSLRRLIVTLTAFTAGHSITLALTTLGHLQASAALMELCIALTLVAVAWELLRDKPSLLGRHPAWMAGLFGLLHGMGFAGALSEIGLPPGDIPLALLAFNVGIEMGQLAVVMTFLMLVRGTAQLLGNRPPRTLQRPVTLLGAYLIGSLAVLWCLERVVLLEKTLSVT